jgi:tRNA dimethylallyltransferase
LAQAPHHFINSLSVAQDYTVGDFEKDALAVLEQLFEKKDLAILVGGSGLFIRALCEGLDAFPDVPEAIKNELEDLYNSQGINALQAELANSDPAYFAKVDTHNPQRLLRALSVIRASGLPFSSFQQQEKAKRPFEPIYILLEMERRELYDRINKRVDWMVENGLVEEARSLFPQKHLNALQTVGYQELFEHFEGKTSLAQAVDLIKQNSRRYAKRQMTWFRKYGGWDSFPPDSTQEIIAWVEEKTRAA